MTEPNRNCPDCGGSLPPDALDGACPRCMLAEGLLLDGDDGAGAAHPDGRLGGDAPTERPRPEPPSVEEIARHFPSLSVEELIGAAGMGLVYRARQKALDRLVALKVLWPEFAADPAFSDRFTREARAMARLDHANIVRVLEFGDRDGLCYRVMEHVEGKNLRELLDEGAIHPAEAAEAAEAAGMSLSATKSAIHRLRTSYRAL